MFAVESLKGQEKLLLEYLQLKTHVENVRLLSCHGEHFLQESTVFKAPTKWLLKGL